MWNKYTSRECLRALALTLKWTRNSLGGARLGFSRLLKTLFAKIKSDWSLKCSAGSNGES